jgi:hypothetical protein
MENWLWVWRNSWPALVPQLLEVAPVEGNAGLSLVPLVWPFVQPLGPLANAVEGSLGLTLIHSFGVGDQAGDGLSVPRDDDLLAALDAVEKSSKSVFGFESADFMHKLI